jgi:hypothetical protein
MGGEWWFHFKGDKSTFDVTNYQTLLIGIKQEFKDEMAICEYGDANAFWCEDNNIPPVDNIFARFTYSCSRHPHWGDSGHKPVWILFWDPTIEQNNSSDVHADVLTTFTSKSYLSIYR